MIHFFTYNRLLSSGKKVLALLLLLLCHTLLPAQVLRSIALQNGSSIHRVQRLIQHPLGYLLAGTQNGLYSFNGAVFTKIDLDTAIASSNITAIGILKNDEVWLGFQNGHLGKLVQNKVQLLRFEEGDFKVPVTDILQDKNGRIWCATGGEGIYCYQNRKWYNVNSDDGLSDNYVYDLLMTKQNQLLAATDAGVNQVQLTGQQKRIHFVSASRGLSDNITTCLAELPDGRILAGHEQNGFSLLQSVNNLLSVTAANRQWQFGRVNTLQIIPPYIYAVTADSGLVYAAVSDSLAFAPVPGMNTANQAALADQEGNLWGAAPGEMMLTRYPMQRLLVKPQMANDNAVHALMADRQGNVWYGYHNQLYMVTPGSGHLKQVVVLPTPAMQTEITNLHQDEAGIIWVGTMGHGIWLLHPVTKALKSLQAVAASAETNVLSISGKGQLVWVSSLEGTARYTWNTVDGDWPRYSRQALSEINSIGTNYIYDIFIDSRGRTWFATDGKGITMLDGDRIFHFSEKEGLGNDVAYSIVEDGKGRVWVNVLNGGLYYYGTDNRWHHFAEAQGLSTSNVSSLIADASGNVVAIASGGFDVIDAGTLSIKQFAEAEGVGKPSADIHGATALPNGSIALITEKGLQQIKTDARVKAPQVFIESVELFLNAINWQATNRFGSDENNLGIHFNAINLLHPEQLRFQYMLEGLGNTWVTTSDRYVNFPQLPPGTYHFKVRASVNKQFLLSPVVVYSFTIERPVWQRWWFLALAALMLAGIVILIIRYRDRQREHVQALQQAHLQSQLETLRSQVSPHFFFNSLNTLMSLIDEDKQQALQYTAHLSDFFRRIVQLRNEDAILLQEELELVEDYLFIQRQRFGNGIQLHNKMNSDVVHSKKIAPLTLQLLVENAIKHNAFTEQQPLHITLHAESDRLVVSNNKQQKIGKEPGTGMGLQNIKHRYQLLTMHEVLVQEDAHHFRVSLPLL